MKPIRLEFQGIKSYVQKTIIDFSKLTRDGVFGIFGNTGSGKSTILDSMLLSLYGRTASTSSATDFVNYACQTAYVDFVFSMNDSSGEKIYRTWHEFKVKLSPRKLAGHKALLTEITKDAELPIAEGADLCVEKIEEIIGLKFNEFLKCIILPQGQFASFVSQTKGERVKLMGRLFDLDKYGETLYRKVKDKVGNINAEIYAKDCLIESYQEATMSNVLEVEKQLELLLEEQKTENVKLSKIKEQFSEFEKNYDTHNKLLSAELEYEKLMRLKPLIEKKKSLIDKYHFAVFAKNLSMEIEEFKSKQTKVLAEFSLEENRLKSLKLERDKLSSKKKEIDQIEEFINECKLKLKMVETISYDVELNEKRLIELESLRGKCKLLKNEIDGNLSIKDDLQNKLNKLDKEFQDKEIKASISNNLSKLQVVASADFIDEEIQFLNDIEAIVTGKALELINNRIEKLSTDSNIANDITLRQLLSELERLYEASDKYSTQRQNFVSQISQIEAKTESSNVKMESVVLEGKKIKAEYDRTQAKINEILSGKNCEDYVEVLKEQIEQSNERKNNFEQSWVENADGIVDCEKKCSSLQTLKIENDKIIADKIKQYDEYVFDKFDGEAEVLKIISTVDNYDLIKKEVEDFFNREYALKSAIEQMRENLPEGDFSKENYLRKKQEFDLLVENCIYLDKNIDKLRERHINLSLIFEKRCIIEADKNKLEEQSKLYQLLLDVIKSNALVQFVADEYLKEIALSAKKTLLTLTDGRFGLCYENDFLIEDNLHGGEKRKIDTVSGGELFLVSLSLALALSKSIYSKSLRPIEFFFLDEGFGSLDKELVETVIESLNKLKDEHLLIGVISHVDALKDRIGTKILVSGSVGHKGSVAEIL